MAGKSSQDDGLSPLWPVKLAIKLLFLGILGTVIALVTMALYLWRFETSASFVSHLENTAVFYVEHSLNPNFATKGGEIAQRVILKETQLGKLQNSSNQNFQKFASGITFWQFLNYNSYILGTKIATLLIFSPLLILSVAIAFIDGLGERYIRRMEAGNESATRYHFWKKLSHSAGPTLVIICFLMCPVAVNPLYFLITILCSLVFGVRNQTKYFKKYM